MNSKEPEFEKNGIQKKSSKVNNYKTFEDEESIAEKIRSINDPKFQFIKKIHRISPVVGDVIIIF